MAARSTDGLSIYEYYSCPFCARVRHFLIEHGIHVELRDVLGKPAFRRELIEATGSSAVPCLRIEEDDEVRWMHESSEIIVYLRERFAG